jgi:hypothetical protein
MGAHRVQILRRKALTQRITHQQAQPPDTPFPFQRIGDQINRSGG